MLYHVSARTKNILLLVWERDASAREFVAGFAHYSNSKANWSIRLMHATDALISNTARDIASGLYDGIVLTDTFLATHPEFGENPSTNVTIIGEVGVCPRLPRGRFASVNIDNREIGGLAARHFISLGRFARHAFIPPAISEAWVRQRIDGFRRKLAAAKLPCDVFDQSIPLAEWLKALPKPAAIMAACDYTAVEVMTACERASLRIPQDVSIIGVDDDELLCEFTRPSLSSIRPEHFTSGHLAARALNGLFQNGSKTPSWQKTILCSGARLIERESTHFVSPALHLIHSAIAYIKASVCKEITVDDVVCHLGVSRRLADLRFREYNGKSILETITEIKLKELSTRLLTSNRAIGNIAATLGFRDLSYLGRLFRNRYGMTMSDWRNGHHS